MKKIVFTVVLGMASQAHDAPCSRLAAQKILVDDALRSRIPWSELDVLITYLKSEGSAAIPAAARLDAGPYNMRAGTSGYSVSDAGPGDVRAARPGTGGWLARRTDVAFGYINSAVAELQAQENFGLAMAQKVGQNEPVTSAGTGGPLRVVDYGTNGPLSYYQKMDQVSGMIRAIGSQLTVLYRLYTDSHGNKAAERGQRAAVELICQTALGALNKIKIGSNGGYDDFIKTHPPSHGPVYGPAEYQVAWDGVNGSPADRNQNNDCMMTASMISLLDIAHTVLAALLGAYHGGAIGQGERDQAIAKQINHAVTVYNRVASYVTALHDYQRLITDTPHLTGQAAKQVAPAQGKTAAANTTDGSLRMAQHPQLQAIQ